jgi:hypothetical protein
MKITFKTKGGKPARVAINRTARTRRYAIVHETDGKTELLQLGLGVGEAGAYIRAWGEGGKAMSPARRRARGRMRRVPISGCTVVL